MPKTDTDPKPVQTPSSASPSTPGYDSLPVLRDKRGQIIREFDILRVFHFYGRRRGKGHEKHYMYKIAGVKIDPKIGKHWWFYHTAEMGEGLTNGYFAGLSDATLNDTEVLDSPATLRDENNTRSRNHSHHNDEQSHPIPQKSKPE